MKKLSKSLLSIGLIGATAAGLAPILTSCGDNKESPEQEAKHIKLSYSTPVVGNNFVITFTLGSGYALDLKDSVIEFSGTNTKVYLSQCVIDTENKTITVPGLLVTSTTVSVNVKSVKPQKTSEAEKIKAIKEVLYSYDSKNMTLTGHGSAKYFEGSTIQELIIPDTEIKMVGHNIAAENIEFDEHSEPKKVKSWAKKADDLGWVVIYTDTYQTPTVVGEPSPVYPAEQILHIDGINIEQFVKKLEFNDVLDTYSYPYSLSQTECVYLSFAFDHQKTLKFFSVESYFENEGNASLDIMSYIPTARGSTSAITDIPTTYQEVSTVKPNQFTYTSGRLEAQHTSFGWFSVPNKILSPSLTEYTDFDPTQKTYIWLDGITYEIIEGLTTLLKNGNTEIPSSSYKFVWGKKSKTYLEINANTLNKNSDLKFIFGTSGYSYSGGDIKVIITQTQPQ